MIYLSTTVIFVSVKFPWKFFQAKSWNVLKIRKWYFIDSIKMLHAKYHWLKQFEMNDKHQVQLYSFGISTGITTLLGLFYIIDQGSADGRKLHCNYHEKWFTGPLNPDPAHYHARESGTCVLRKHNFDEFMFSIFQGSLSLHPVVKPTKWVIWIQSDCVKESIDEIRTHRQTGFFLTLGLVVIMILLPLLVNSFFVWIILSSSKVSMVLGIL